MSTFVYLHVPYLEKDRAKELGCKWDSSKKQWFSAPHNKNLLDCIELWGSDKEDSMVNTFSNEQIAQYSEKDKIAYEKSIQDYSDKFISIGGSIPIYTDTQQNYIEQDEQELPPPLIYETRSRMINDEKVSGSCFKRKCIILDEQ